MKAITSLKDNQKKLHEMSVWYHKIPKISHSSVVTEENLPEGSTFCPSPEFLKTGNEHS